MDVAAGWQAEGFVFTCRVVVVEGWQVDSFAFICHVIVAAGWQVEGSVCGTREAAQRSPAGGSDAPHAPVPGVCG